MIALSKKQLTWLIGLATLLAIGLLMYALYEQEVKQLYPCVRCIYQRVGVIGLISMGLLALSHPKLRLLGLTGSLFASGFGYYHADIHTQVVYGNIVDICGFRADFGIFGNLDTVVPILFEAGGNCVDRSWQVLQMTMPEWMKIIFSCYFFGAILCIILWIRASLQATRQT